MNRSKVIDISRRFALPAMLAFCTLFYYFGELVDWAAWDALRWDFFYSIHDVHRLLFLIPIIYAGYTARVKGAVIVTLLTFAIFLPRAFFISPYPDPMLRMVLFTIIAGVIGALTGVVRNRSERCCQLEANIRSERDTLLSIIAGIADGVIIIGPDYGIRFTNPNMAKYLGDSTGQLCYKYLNNLGAPCEKGCRMPDVISKGKIARWEHIFADGKTCEIVAAPYVDADGAVCQLTIFKNIAPGKKSGGKHQNENGFSWLSPKL
ncbi:MAG: PAS domain-containing protein [Dehalococcoidales bacterium]|nr:PAS domain-containing protein [Dehalococcoidales bacterium]